jgi:Fur family transcriptional regulator, peroxide stress response regulator
MNKVQQRQTKYCTAIELLLPSLGHASNADLIKHIRLQFPEVSATTVHRATARLAERGVIAIAPSTKDGAIRYDANVRPHDHFMCESCGLLRDADVKEFVVPTLEQHIGDCSISGRLTISGVCKKCTKGNAK